MLIHVHHSFFKSRLSSMFYIGTFINSATPLAGRLNTDRSTPPVLVSGRPIMTSLTKCTNTKHAGLQNIYCTLTNGHGLREGVAV